MSAQKHPQQVCRTCLNVVKSSGQFFNLNSAGLNTKPTTMLWHKLRDCVPELDLKITPRAVVCKDCAIAVDLAYKFKTKCLQTEELIHSYLKNADSSRVELDEIIRFYEGEDIHKLTKSKTQEIRKINGKSRRSYEINGRKACLEHYISEPKQAKLIDVKTEVNIAEESEFVGVAIKTEQSGAKIEVELLLQSPFLNSKIEGSKHEQVDGDKTEHELVNSEPEARVMPEVVNVSGLQTEPEYVASIETGEKQFRCEICNYNTAQRINLSKHMRIHLKENYECHDCGYKTEYKTLLIKHVQNHKKPYMKRHAEGTMHKCDLCSYVTSSYLFMNRHMNIHTKPYRCTVCTYKTSANHWLQKHMKRH